VVVCPTRHGHPRRRRLRRLASVRRELDTPTRTAGPSPETTSIQLWWRASDAQALCERAAADGITIFAEPFEGPFGRTFTMADPDGYRITDWNLRASLTWSSAAVGPHVQRTGPLAVRDHRHER
jgi:hypothetical protein